MTGRPPVDGAQGLRFKQAPRKPWLDSDLRRGQAKPALSVTGGGVERNPRAGTELQPHSRALALPITRDELHAEIAALPAQWRVQSRVSLSHGRMEPGGRSCPCRPVKFGAVRRQYLLSGHVAILIASAKLRSIRR